MEQTEEL